MDTQGDKKIKSKAVSPYDNIAEHNLNEKSCFDTEETSKVAQSSDFAEHAVTDNHNVTSSTNNENERIMPLTIDTPSLYNSIDENCIFQKLGSGGVLCGKNYAESIKSDDSLDAEVFLDLPSVKFDRLLIPPLNFAMVEKGVYRSGYPNRRNFSFLHKLGIRSIVCLSLLDSDSNKGEKICRENELFITEHGIRRFLVPLNGQKEPFTTTSVEQVERALKNILDVSNHPVLVHCDKGKHQTGTVIGCLRKLQGWGLSSVFDEYARFCKITSTRMLDHQFMEFFDIGFTEKEVEVLPEWMWSHK